jgi:hypothetical protein
LDGDTKLTFETDVKPDKLDAAKANDIIIKGTGFDKKKVTITMNGIQVSDSMVTIVPTLMHINYTVTAADKLKKQVILTISTGGPKPDFMHTFDVV